MKKPFFLITTLVLFGCTNPIKKNISPKAGPLPSQNIVPQKKVLPDKDGQDTVNVSTDDSNVSKYSKGDLKRILKKDPELNADVPSPPDICWGKSLNFSGDYDCEACRDDYYALYAYFLRAKNGEPKYRQQRKTLIELYRNIDELFDRLNGGGTYYGHQYTRILGYAEWSIYVYKENGNYIKSYDITKQKGLYIRSLKQYLDDEVNNDPELSPDEKTKKLKDLLGRVNVIGQSITTHFYLVMAQEFQYSNY